MVLVGPAAFFHDELAHGRIDHRDRREDILGIFDWSVQSEVRANCNGRGACRGNTRFCGLFAHFALQPLPHSNRIVHSAAAGKSKLVLDIEDRTARLTHGCQVHHAGIDDQLANPRFVHSGKKFPDGLDTALRGKILQIVGQDESTLDTSLTYRRQFVIIDLGLYRIVNDTVCQAGFGDVFQSRESHVGGRAVNQQGHLGDTCGKL